MSLKTLYQEMSGDTVNQLLIILFWFGLLTPIFLILFAYDVAVTAFNSMLEPTSAGVREDDHQEVLSRG